MPRELLWSEDHLPFDVVLWATYERLERKAAGGRLPATARRCWIGDLYGIGTTAVDDARRRLVEHGWLQRLELLGRKRSRHHRALRRPEETRAPYVRMPQWARDLVWAGRTRPAGHVSPGAWVLYGRLIDRVRGGGDLSLSTLGKWIGASTDTAGRLVTQLEGAGMLAVTARPGGAATMRPVVDQAEAERLAGEYAERGRERGEPRKDPPKLAALPSGNERQPGTAGSGTPRYAPDSESPRGDARVPTVGGELEVVGERADEADAGRSGESATGTVRRRRRRAPERIGDAARLYPLLPPALRTRIPEDGSERVLRALAGELEHRTVAELAERLVDRWEPWRYQTGQIYDATAVAMKVVERGYWCPDVRCEAHTNLDTGRACRACVPVVREGGDEEGAGSAEYGTSAPEDGGEAASWPLRGEQEAGSWTRGEAEDGTGALRGAQKSAPEVYARGMAACRAAMGAARRGGSARER